MSNKKQTRKGTLIAVEGIDGSGKSTLVKNIHQQLCQKGIDALATKEPGGTPIGVYFMNILRKEKKPLTSKAEYLLYAVDRAEHFEQVIIPYMAKGTIIISDRMADSSLAYQGYGRQLDIEMIKQINKWATTGIVPDLIFYLRIDKETAYKRLKQRSDKLTYFEKEDPTFWERVIVGFETIFKEKKNVVLLDATVSAEELTCQALEELYKRTILQK